jgi:predicted nucleic acid-binding protein
MEFFDTSVLVAAGQVTHVHHDRSFERVAVATKLRSCCALHTFAEVYSSMTAMPPPVTLPPNDVLRFVQDLERRLVPIALDAQEYLETIEKTAARGLTSGKIYDALLLACAAKSQAQIIYTWNLKHFHSIAPDLADRIQQP